MKPPPLDDPDAPVLVVDVGNHSVKLGIWSQGSVKGRLSVATGDASAFDRALEAERQSFPRRLPPAVVIASVVPAVLEQLCSGPLTVFPRRPLVVGDSIPLPMDVGVDYPKAIGVDRVCAAAAAYERLRTACTVVDFGTAITVDLVDDDGVLMGGAILPGIEMQLRALHEHTAVLPHVAPDTCPFPYGRNTTEAIQTGVGRGVVGAVRAIVEGYATHLNRWPQVVATGGDLPAIAAQFDFLDTLTDGLTLSGIGLAYRRHLAAMGA